uniref:Maturase n=1 Tax=Euglena hiemalis TaxID=392896 RepID=A0A345UC22_9EUGL|nr:maturase [Euglena hiemalis]AXI98008.1 maturase [Euglena hiemalis]
MFYFTLSGSTFSRLKKMITSDLLYYEFFIFSFNYINFFNSTNFNYLKFLPFKLRAFPYFENSDLFSPHFALLSLKVWDKQIIFYMTLKVLRSFTSINKTRLKNIFLKFLKNTFIWQELEKLVNTGFVNISNSSIYSSRNYLFSSSLSPFLFNLYMLEIDFFLEKFIFKYSIKRNLYKSFKNLKIFFLLININNLLVFCILSKNRAISNIHFLFFEDIDIIKIFGFVAYSFLHWFVLCEDFFRLRYLVGLIKESCFLTLCRKHNKSKVWAYSAYTFDLIISKNLHFTKSFFPKQKDFNFKKINSLSSWYFDFNDSLFLED